jgi:hypothetical protein
MTVPESATVERHSLAWYVGELVARLDDGESSALNRLRMICGSHRGRIGLGEQAIVVSFGTDGTLVVVDADGTDVDGVGWTRPAVVLALLAGDLEITDAILDGEIEVRGNTDAVTAMFCAIEIVIDCSSRVPALRELADAYVTEYSSGLEPKPDSGGTNWPPSLVDAQEMELLRGLGLRLG